MHMNVLNFWAKLLANVTKYNKYEIVNCAVWLLRIIAVVYNKGESV